MAAKKKKYNLTADITVSMHVTVLAASEEEAIEKANELPVMSLCHQCAGDGEGDEWVTSGELDGELSNIRVDE